MGSRRFFSKGRGISCTQSSSYSLSLVVKRVVDMFRAGYIPNLFRGRQTGGWVGSFVPHQCNKSHMLRYFARAIASQSSGQTPPQEPTKKRGWRIIGSSRVQGESSTKFSLNQFPGLLVPGMTRNSKTRRLLRMNPDTGYFPEQDAASSANHPVHYDLQVPNFHVCRGSAYGWLFVTDDYLDMKLLNPFSGAEIQLPPVKTLPSFEKYKEEWRDMPKWFVSKAVFSANPSIEPRPVVLIIYGGQFSSRLAFCKPGDNGWTPLEFPEFSIHKDAIYHNGQFYVLGCPGPVYVAAFDIGRRIDDDDHSVKKKVVATLPKTRLNMRDLYLVVLDGELVTFELRSLCFRDCCFYMNMKILKKEWKRDGDTSDEDDYTDHDKPPLSFRGGVHLIRTEIIGLHCAHLPHRTYGIKIRRFDVSEKQWVKVESLGDKAVFLGYNTSFAVSASDYPAGVCIPNSVYFSNGGGGIYNVKDKTIKPIYSPMVYKGSSSFTKPAPIWIVYSAIDILKVIDKSETQRQR